VYFIIHLFILFFVLLTLPCLLASLPVLHPSAKSVVGSFPQRLDELKLVVIRQLTNILSRLLDPHLSRVVTDDEIRVKSVRVVIARCELRVFLSINVERHHANLREMQRHIRRHTLGVLDAERHHLSISVQTIQQLPALVLIVKVLESALLPLDPVSILPRKRGLDSVNLSSLGTHCCW